MSEYLEDFAPDRVYRSGRIRVEPDHVKSFASEFDPQPFHLDEGAARRSIFGGLAASGATTNCQLKQSLLRIHWLTIRA